MQNNTRDEDKTKKQLIDELVGLRRHVGRLTSISEDLDASAYTVAHDLKRSLSLILGFSELLLKEYDTVPREELLRCLQMIVESGRKMNRIVDELMLLVHVRDEESPSVGPLKMLCMSLGCVEVHHATSAVVASPTAIKAHSLNAETRFIAASLLDIP